MRDILSRARTTCKRNTRSLDYSLKPKSPINTCLIRDKTIAFFSCFFFFYSYLLSCLSKSNDRCTHEVHIRASRRYRARRTSATCRRADAVRSRSVLVIGEDRILQSKIYDEEIAMFSPSSHRSAPLQYRRSALSSSRFVRACRGLRVLSQSVALDVGGDVLLLLFRETVLQRSTH